MDFQLDVTPYSSDARGRINGAICDSHKRYSRDDQLNAAATARPCTDLALEGGLMTVMDGDRRIANAEAGDSFLSLTAH
ncbi:unnamed protein product, partial [Iphiclides podalirius]